MIVFGCTGAVVPRERVVVYDGNMPLYLLTIFGKGDKDNLSKSERNELGKLAKLIVGSWRKGNG